MAGDFTRERVAWHSNYQERHSLKTWTGILDHLSEGACYENPLGCKECSALSEVVGEWMAVRDMILEHAETTDVLSARMLMSRIVELCVKSARAEL